MVCAEKRVRSMVSDGITSLVGNAITASSFSGGSLSERSPHTLVARIESDGLGLEDIRPQLVVLRVGVVALALGDGHRQVRLQPRHDRVGIGPRRLFR